MQRTWNQVFTKEVQAVAERGKPYARKPMGTKDQGYVDEYWN